MFFPCCTSSVFGFLFPLCPFSLLLFSLFLFRFFVLPFFCSLYLSRFALLPFSFPFFCSSFFLPFRLFLFGFSLFFFFPLSPSPSPSFLFFLVSLVVFYALLFANKKLLCSCCKDSLSTILDMRVKEFLMHGTQKYHVVFAQKYRSKAFYGGRRLETGTALGNYADGKEQVLLRRMPALWPEYSVSLIMG